MQVKVLDKYDTRYQDITVKGFECRKNLHCVINVLHHKLQNYEGSNMKRICSIVANFSVTTSNISN